MNNLRFLLILAFCILWFDPGAQTDLDSIMAFAGYPKADEDAVLSLYDAAYELEFTDPAMALSIYKKGIEWSRSFDYDNGMGKGYNYSGIVWFNMGEIDSAILYAQTSLEWLKRAGNQLGYAASLNNIGNGHNVHNNYPEAIQYYQEANKVYESLGEEVNIISNLNNIGNMLVRSRNYEQAETYLMDALQRAEKTNFTSGLGDVNNNLGGLEEVRGNINHAFEYYSKGLEYYREIGETNFIVQGLSNIGKCHFGLENNVEALSLFKEAIAMLDTLDLPREKVDALISTANVYNAMGEYRKGVNTALQAYPIAKDIGDHIFRQSLLQSLVNGYEGLGDYVSVAKYNRELLEETRQLFDIEKNKQLLDLEKKYESEKKERLILEQKLQLQKKSAQNRLVLILSGLAVIAALLIIFWLRTRLRINKKLTAQQAEIQVRRIKEMEQEQTLMAMDAMLQGQEEERSRIAKDLHDGLGGLLASVKMHFTAFVDEIKADLPGKLGNKTNDLLDQAAQEVRRVAHNMMPTALLKEGLIAAIEDISEGIRRGQGMKIIVQSIGNVEFLPDTHKLTIYRIIQELLQNTVKHANASKIIVQLHQHDDEISLIVEDDGLGFDASKVKRGLGLDSIASRVQYLKGRLDIDSIPGEGTTFMINLPMPEDAKIN